MFYKTISGRKMMTILSVLLAITVMSGLVAGQYVSSASATKKLPIYSVQTDKKQVAITFDAAWTNQDTDELIETLKKHNAVATFFIVGDWAEKFPESVKAFYQAGHTIANHSDTHKAFSKCSREEIKKEIVDCNEKLEKIIGEKLFWYEHRQGTTQEKVLKLLRALECRQFNGIVTALIIQKYPLKKS